MKVNSALILLLSSSLSLRVTHCEKLMKIDREILKTGLHRSLRTNVTFFVDDPSVDYQCDYVFRETVSKDVYLMLEEMEALGGFEFWPHDYQDVEKPSSQAKDYEFIWRLPLRHDKDKLPSWIKNHAHKKEEDEQELVHLQIVYPFHFRYQPAREGMKYTKVAFPGPPNVYKDCNSPEKTPLKSFSKFSEQYPPKKNLVTTYNAPQMLHEMIPNGVKEDLPMIQLITLGLTFLGFIILT